MYRLGDVISSMREDFIVVHLAEPCSYCRSYISDAKRCVHPSDIICKLLHLSSQACTTLSAHWASMLARRARIHQVPHGRTRHLPDHSCEAEGELPGRYYHPAPPSRVTMKSERTFEGISLDQPGFSSKQVSTLSRFQLCGTCYGNELAGCARGLCGRISLRMVALCSLCHRKHVRP